MKNRRFVPLRYRFIFITSLMLILLMGTLALVLGLLQTRTIRGRIEKQGLDTAKNLASVSVEHLVTYNYVALEKLANQAVNNPDIIYVIIHDKEGRVAGYSNRSDLQNKILTDKVSQAAIAAGKPSISLRNHQSAATAVMDVAVPVFLPGSLDRWGTIRVCMSLELMYQQIRQTRWIILVLGSIAIAIGILVSNWAAQRVTRPLDSLVTATMEAAQGNLKQNIVIRTGDEVEILASNFSHMIREVLAQKEQLQDQVKEILRLQQYAQKVLAFMSDGLLAVDMDGIVTSVNPAAHAILNIPLTQALKGSPVLDFLPAEGQLAGYIRETLENPAGKNLREIHLPRGQETRVILMGSGILATGEKKSQEIIFNLNDITALKKLEAQIRQGQRLADLGTLAAGMAHEIRNPLSAIKTYVALLPKKIEKPGFLEKFQKTVPREINRLNTLIEELLELSRPPKYNFKLTDIKGLLAQIIELQEDDFKARNIAFNCSIPQDLIPIMVDENQLEKAFLNLVQNAGQAMPEGGVLSILVMQEKSGVALEFRDTGQGMSPDTCENIFNPFFTTKSGGTGLGLAITHKVIKEHGGHIEVQSSKGKGSSFFVHLP